MKRIADSTRNKREVRARRQRLKYKEKRKPKTTMRREETEK